MRDEKLTEMLLLTYVFTAWMRPRDESVHCCVAEALYRKLCRIDVLNGYCYEYLERLFLWKDEKKHFRMKQCQCCAGKVQVRTQCSGRTSRAFTESPGCYCIVIFALAR